MNHGETVRQLCGGGYGRLVAMLGAHSFEHGGYSLAFAWRARGLNGINHARIELDASDTYTVELSRVRQGRRTIVATTRGVYCDSLRSIFESRTGLRVSL